MRRLILKAAAASVLGLATSAFAQGYPDRPIRLVVPFAAGGSTDVLARLLAQSLSQRLGQSVIVDNRAGAGTNLGAAFAAQAPADGYTLFMASSTQAINVTLYRSLSYELERDFVAVAPVATSPSVLVVNPGVPANTLAELVALLRSRPGALSYASSGNGSTAHLAGEQFKAVTGTDMLHVPYRGAGPALNDLLGGQVQVMFGFTAGSLPYIRNGQMRPLAVTSATRIPELPDVPTMAEAGAAGAEVDVWYGVLAPAGTPAAIVQQLNTAIGAAVQELTPRFAELGAYPLHSTPAEYGAFIRAEVVRWREIVRRSNAHVD